ncbi:MAG TPA: nucleoside transporter C-terminal domain-containing protein [Bryobacterales bacterium]|nr:nucleoside transporter C-terminal domain-containing protein [Bryobacterales bacterium]
MSRFTGVLGLALIVGGAWVFSTNRRAIRLKVVLWGLGLQLVLALLVLRTGVGRVFEFIGRGVTHMLDFAQAGSTFVFWAPAPGGKGPEGVVFAFHVLTIIIFVASFFAVLYYLGVMQWLVKGIAIAMQRIMGSSGAESLDVAASIFMGQTEAPLTIRPFLDNLTDSELLTVMTAGMAHVSGSLIVAYAYIAHVEVKHLLTAVVMTAPATIMLAKMLIPETGQPETSGHVKLHVEKLDINLIDAAARGAIEGLHLALNVGAMLIAFIALIAMSDGILGYAHSFPGLHWMPDSLEKIFGWVFSPFAWALGVSWKDAPIIGNLLGTRMVLNEFLAYVQLGPLKATLDHKSFVIATFALCGFANFSSIAIQVGGIGALAPSRRHDLARLGLRAMIAGTLANFMSAAIAGILL